MRKGIEKVVMGLTSLSSLVDKQETKNQKYYNDTIDKAIGLLIATTLYEELIKDILKG